MTGVPKRYDVEALRSLLRDVGDEQSDLDGEDVLREMREKIANHRRDKDAVQASD